MNNINERLDNLKLEIQKASGGSQKCAKERLLRNLRISRTERQALNDDRGGEHEQHKRKIG